MTAGADGCGLSGHVAGVGARGWGLGDAVCGWEGCETENGWDEGKEGEVFGLSWDTILAFFCKPCSKLCATAVPALGRN